MFLEGEGEQVSLQIALFLYADRGPLLAIAWGKLDKPDFTHLSFFTEEEGKMVSVDTAIFPINNSGGVRFELPRFGRTVIVRDSGGKVVSKWTWNPATFTED